MSKINTIYPYSANPILRCHLHEDYLKAIYYLPVLISIKTLWTMGQKRQNNSFRYQFFDMNRSVLTELIRV
jgi:hypothetical protein